MEKSVEEIEDDKNTAWLDPAVTMAAEENKKVHILGVWMIIVRETLFLALHILSFLINLQV